MTEYRKIESDEDEFLIDWNGRSIRVGDKVLHTAAEGLLTLSKVVKIYQKENKYYKWGVGSVPVLDTLVRLEPLPNGPTNYKKAARTINSRTNEYVWDSLTRWDG